MTKARFRSDLARSVLIDGDEGMILHAIASCSLPSKSLSAGANCSSAPQKNRAKTTSSDLAAQLAYYFFLALFPAVLFILALASFFPLTNLIDDIVGALRPIAPADVLGFLEEQLRRISNTDSGGILTIGILGAIWSSSAAVVAIVGSLNRAYDIEEGRPWWKVRLTAIGLTLGLAVLVLASFTLIVAGPSMA